MPISKLKLRTSVILSDHCVTITAPLFTKIIFTKGVMGRYQTSFFEEFP